LKDNINAEKVRGVIFDLGSTLLEYETIPWDDLSLLCLDAGYDYLKNSGHAVPGKDDFIEKYIAIRQKYRKHSGETLDEWIITDAIGELLSAFDLNGSASLAEDFFAAYHVPLARQVTMFADAPTVLRTLKSNRHKIGLVSNTIFPEDAHVEELKKYAIFNLFDFTIFSSSFGKRKPHPEIYKRATELIGLAPENLLFVGDRYIEDYVGPSDFGMQAMIKFREGRPYPDHMPENVTVIRALVELLDYLDLKIDDK